MHIIIDVVLVAIFVLTIVRFYRKGFVKSLFSLCKVFVSIIAALILTPWVGNIINNKILAFILIFILTMIACGALSFALDKLFKLPLLREINKLFGLALGAVCGFIYMMVSLPLITLILNLISLNTSEISAKIMEEKTIVYSLLSKIDIVSILFIH